MEEKQNNNDSRIDPVYEEGKLNLEDFKGDKNKYFTLFEISKYTPYSQEYLSLRARQGKLKAVKEGRDWVTTINWTKDYLKKLNGKNGKKERAMIILPSMAVMKYSALVLAFFCLGVYTIFNFNGWQGKVKNNILSRASSVKQDFINLSQTFKSDYKNKFKVLGSSLDKTEIATTGGTKKLGNLITGSVNPIREFSITVLSGSKNSIKRGVMLFSKKVNDFSEVIEAADSKTDKIVFRQKKSFSDFYSQGKDDLASLFYGIGFSTKKFSSQLFLFTGKNLVYVNDKFFKLSAESSDFAAIIFKSSKQNLAGLKNLSSNGSLAVRNKFFAGMEILFSSSDKITGSLARSASNGAKTVFSAPKLLWKITGSFAVNEWNRISDKLADGYLALLDYLIPERSDMSSQTLVSRKEAKENETGVIVFPAFGKGDVSQNKHLLAKIEDAFSDEVKVEPAKEGKAGVITPLNPAVPDEKYLYMMVPIDKN